MIKKTRKISFIFIFVFICLFVSACTSKEKQLEDSFKKSDNYENIYQVFVRSFADGNNDGIGDFIGLTEKLDYIKDLGFTSVWLMPFNPSPSYHGYDVVDYYNINKDYGTLNDFLNFSKKAKDLDIDIYMDLVINHTSNQHEWFKKAVNNDATYKDYYVFSNKNANYWHDAGNGKKYFGFFSNQMPDLNLKSDKVKEEIKKIAKFWADAGVSGFRLDGALHYFRSDEYNSAGANYQMGSLFIKELEDYMKSINPNFNIIVEAWDNYLIYAPTFLADASPIDFDMSNLICETALSQTSTKFFYQIDKMFKEYAKYNKDYVPVPFLKNHDMDRLASVAGFDNIVNQRMAAEILLALPGSPIVYYGEELGMKGIRAGGQNGQYDETVRLPYVFGDRYQTKWVKDYNNYNGSIKNVIAQLQDKTSLLNTYKKLLNLRNNNIALKYGNTLEQVETNNNSILCYKRSATYNNKTQTVLIIHNISSKVQNLNNYYGQVIYSTNDLNAVPSSIDGKATIIIDITGSKK